MCTSSEKLYFMFHGFQDNINNAFSSLRKNHEFTDVTLACEYGNQVEAHTVILAASSPFFQKLLNRNRHVHPLIYMRWMKFQNLEAIVDLLYYGEVNIHKDNLDTFLKIAEELELKGFNEGHGGLEEEGEDKITRKKLVVMKIEQFGTDCDQICRMFQLFHCL